MKRLKKIEDAVLKLSDDDFRKLYNWIVELNHKKWDRQIEEDSERGLLDDLANQAVADYRRGFQQNCDASYFSQLLEILQTGSHGNTGTGRQEF